MTAEEKIASRARAMARVDPRWDAARTEQALAGLHRRRTRRRAGALLALGTGIAASALLAWTFTTESPIAATETAASGDHAEAAPPPMRDDDGVVRLADGSHVMPDEGAGVVVEHVSDARISVRIEHGGAALEVVPGLSRRFEVHAGEVTVTVIGTAFRVERVDDVHARVSVERGHVAVSWAGGDADLFAGQGGVFPTGEIAALDVAPDVPDPIAVPVREHAPRATPDPAPVAWRDLARASRYGEAYVALGPPAARSDAVGDDVDDLLLAADVARLSGHAAEALPWLAAVERDHASDPRAVLATFTRGRILMDLGRHAEAGAELERALAMEPHGSLAEDALARAALSYAAAGDDGRAHPLAERYLASYPSGRWSARVRAIAGGPASP